MESEIHAGQEIFLLQGQIIIAKVTLERLLVHNISYNHFNNATYIYDIDA